MEAAKCASDVTCVSQHVTRWPTLKAHYLKNWTANFLDIAGMVSGI